MLKNWPEWVPSTALKKKYLNLEKDFYELICWLENLVGMSKVDNGKTTFGAESQKRLNLSFQ